ncbi:hypothetical protein AMATHDRAFT_67753 [Amanita thiersii Skay4041]|uniref:Histone chaperone RTT106/FACT complex subunit SPT16-like middle domain-containing protein n=1 Tax=Amanita thiersii Skay4041 TaxID=703135 RepID=A0A2A9NBL5_9AGAR|nr:hypothetical protein AMATHDRAFT_67753 [Amanita thiersii Skay4041]
MSHGPSFYRTTLSSLPTELAVQLDQLCQGATAELLLDTLIRFVCGAHCPDAVSDQTRAQWPKSQQDAQKAIDLLFPPHEGFKRPRDSGESQHDNLPPNAKRQKLTPQGELSSPEDYGPPIFTLHGISVTSPVRKKVDITILKNAVRFTTPNTQSIESTIPLSALRRAFLVPTRGKTKAHWTIVMISSDTPDRGKPNSSSALANPQVIFGVDASATSSFVTTTYDPDSNPTPSNVPKGGATLPSLKTFLSHLEGVQVLEPTVDVFKSACVGSGTNAGQDGIPGVEAYRAAKAGDLWFMKEGILWGGSKPCEFWAVEDLLDKSEGVRILNPGGRTFSVALTRKSSDELVEDEEDVGTETEFTLIDSREQDGVNQWIRQHRHLFGKGASSKATGAETPKIEQVHVRRPMTINEIGDESDDEDKDFEMDSSSEENNAESSDESSEDDGERGEDDNESEGTTEDSNIDEEGEEEEELKVENHPLLRPGAVPRMSRAAVDMVVDMVKNDVLGIVESEEEEDEQDELDE